MFTLFNRTPEVATPVTRERMGNGDSTQRLEQILAASRIDAWLVLLGVGLLPLVFAGCTSGSSSRSAKPSATSPLAAYSQLEIEDAAIGQESSDDLGSELPPITLSSWESGEVNFWDLSIEDAIRIGLERSKVFRELGGVVLTAPSATQTVYDPAIVETDPNYGVEGALSAFDAQWSTSLFVEKNDRALNNQFFGGGARILKQDLAEYNTELSKRTATGALLTVRNVAEYDFNNAPANLFTNGAWTVKFETEARQPLLQGRGVDFNRIAGPNGVPGLNQGVLIARVNADVALADFEIAVRNLVQDIETAYWELYFGYRDLDAKADSRDRALNTWRRIQSLAETGQRGGEASREAQARAQFYRQQEEVQNAFAGAAQDKARTITFRGTGGVLQNERRLRLLLSLPIADGTLIRPADEPLVTDLTFSWSESVDEALVRRTELRRQRWEIKRRELELVAARNYLLPRLDAVGRYRWRGFGHELIDTPGGNGDFDNALEDLISGDFTEVQMGVEYKFPIGFRQAHANHRQAQLSLARERAMLDAQERDIVAELTNSVSELDRAYTTLTTNLERREAQSLQLEALETIYEDDTTDESQRLRLLDLILDAQRNLADVESRCYRGQVEYQLAVRQVHFAKGSLLEYNGIILNEGAWSREAIESARDQARRRRTMPHLVNYIMPARRLSDGPVSDVWESAPGVSQEILPGNLLLEESSPSGEEKPMANGASSDTAGVQIEAESPQAQSANFANGEQNAQIVPFPPLNASGSPSPSTNASVVPVQSLPTRTDALAPSPTRFVPLGTTQTPSRTHVADVPSELSNATPSDRSLIQPANVPVAPMGTGIVPLPILPPTTSPAGERTQIVPHQTPTTDSTGASAATTPITVPGLAIRPASPANTAAPAATSGERSAADAPVTIVPTSRFSPVPNSLAPAPVTTSGSSGFTPVPAGSLQPQATTTLSSASPRASVSNELSAAVRNVAASAAIVPSTPITSPISAAPGPVVGGTIVPATGGASAAAVSPNPTSQRSTIVTPAAVPATTPSTTSDAPVPPSQSTTPETGERDFPGARRSFRG